MKILAVETSCDDTGIALLEASEVGDFKVLSNIVSSQTEVHQKYGGVFPAMAKREHQKNLVPTLQEALLKAELLKGKKSEIPEEKLKILKEILSREPELEEQLISFLQKYEKPDADLIAVTNGPGLEPCLWVGVNFTKCLSYIWNIPVVPVNHIESHILANTLKNPKMEFPAIALVVSGGHTQIILVKGIGKYKILGETRDDAAGECFDKCAKILGLGYPGGPIISKLAENLIEARPLSDRGRASIQLPRPMMNTKDYDFSFSGLKTAVLYSWQKQNSKFFASRQKTYQAQIIFAAEIQQAIIDVLLKKTIKVAKDYKAKTIILGGGVSANQELRKQFKQATKKLCNFLPPDKKLHTISIVSPDSNLSADNAVMAAITGFYHQKNMQPWQKLSADANLRISK